HTGHKSRHEVTYTAPGKKRLAGGIPEMGHTFFTFSFFVLMQSCCDRTGQTPADKPVCYRL
ncbi:hypothetical protein C9974_16925, partial [Marinobacter sp. B9-2]